MARPQTAMGLIRGDMAGGAPKQVIIIIITIAGSPE